MLKITPKEWTALINAVNAMKPEDAIHSTEVDILADWLREEINQPDSHGWQLFNNGEWRGNVNVWKRIVCKFAYIHRENRTRWLAALVAKRYVENDLIYSFLDPTQVEKVIDGLWKARQLMTAFKEKPDKFEDYFWEAIEETQLHLFKLYLKPIEDLNAFLFECIKNANIKKEKLIIEQLPEGAEDRIIANEDDNMIGIIEQEIIANLPLDEQDAFHLRHIEDKSWQDISNYLNEKYNRDPPYNPNMLTQRNTALIRQIREYLRRR